MQAASQTTTVLPYRLDTAAFARQGPADGQGWRRRAMLRAAEHLARVPTCWEPNGRGPQAFDWLGLVRCAGQVVRDLEHGRPAKDLSDLPSAEPLQPAAVKRLFEAWGLSPIPARQAEPGDLFLFALPHAHAAVLTIARFGPRAGIVHAPDHLGVLHGVMQSLAPRTVHAFTWERR